MQNIVVVNQPNRLNVVRGFMKSRGIERYAIVKDSAELFDYLLVETSNVHLFDFYMDMSLLNTVNDMRDSVNTLTVYAPDARIGEPYLTITDKVFIMPNEVDLLCWYWDSATCNIQNVMACKASNKPFCYISLPNTKIQPSRIRVDVRSRKIPATYQMLSGTLKNTKVDQLNVSVKLKGKPLADFDNIRHQTGIFGSAQRQLDLPATGDSETYTGQTTTAEPIKHGGFLEWLMFWKHEKKVKVPKEPKLKTIKPVKEPKVKPVKEPKVKKIKPVKEPKVKPIKEPKVKTVKQVAEPTSAKPNVYVAPPVFEPIVQEVKSVDDLVQPTVDKSVKTDEAPKTKKSMFSSHKKSVEVELEGKETFADGSLIDDIDMQQEFANIAGRIAVAEDMKIDTSEVIETTQPVVAVAEPVAVIDADPEPETVVEEPVIVEEPVAVKAPHQKIEVVLPTVSNPLETVERKGSGLKMNKLDLRTYTTVDEYLVGNEFITTAQCTEVLKVVRERSKPGHSAKFGDVALELGFIDTETLVTAVAKVMRIEMIGWKQLEKMSVNYDDFSQSRCQELKFFRTDDDVNGNVQIIASSSISSLDSSIRRLFDSPRIRYTIEAYINIKLK